MNLSTPAYDLTNYPDVYEPREDTFLFLDALEAEAEFLKKFNPKILVEIGSGSGVVITALHQILGSNCVYFAIDINPQCCLATKRSSTLNKTEVECVNMNLLSNFKNNLFDVILFNPPYVVTDAEETAGVGLSLAWAGGNKGREIIDKVIRDLPNLLTQNGVCYMVLLKENQIEDIVAMATQIGLKSELIIQRKIPAEHLFVYKFTV